MQQVIRVNDEKVFDALQSQWPFPLDRPQLVKLTGMPRTTIYDALMRLKREGRVVAFPVNNYQRGRPRTFFFSVPLKPEELSADEWARISQAQEEVREFYSQLEDDAELFCMLKNRETRYFWIREECATCGLRVQCVQNNKEVVNIGKV